MFDLGRTDVEGQGLGSDACGSQDMIIKAPVCVASNTRPAVERVQVGTLCFARKSIGGEEPKCP